MTNSPLLKSSLVVTVVSFGASMASFASQLVIALFFGASSRLDTYLIAISVPMLFTGMAAGLFSYSIVPILVRYRVMNDNAYRELTGALLFGFAFLALIICLVVYPLTPSIVRLLAPNAQSAVNTDIVHMMRIGWLVFGSTIITSYLGAVYNAGKRFFVPAISLIFPYLSIILFTWTLSSRLGVSCLVWGMLGGNMAAIVLMYKGVSKEISFSLSALCKAWRHISPIVARIPLFLTSTLCFTIYGTIDAYWAAGLGPGCLSYLGYGQRLLIAVGSIATIGPLTVLTPYLSEQAVAGEMNKFREMLASSIRLTIAITAFLAISLSILRFSLIQVLFQRGAFDMTATQGVASVLPGMLFGMVPMVCVTLMLKGLHAGGKVKGAALVGGSGAAIYFTASGILSRFLGLQGIVLAYLATWWFLFFFSICLIWRNKILSFAKENFSFAARLSITLLSMATVLYLLERLWMHTEHSSDPLLASAHLLSSSGFAAVFFIASAVYVARIPELVRLFLFFIPDRLQTIRTMTIKAANLDF